MTRKEKELKLIEAFGLKVGDKVAYTNNLHGDKSKRYATIIDCDNCIMLDQGYCKTIVESLVILEYGSDRYQVGPYCHRRSWEYSCKDRKYRARKILKVLGLKIGDKLHHKSLMTDEGIIIEDTCDIKLESIDHNGTRWGTPLWTFIRDNDWTKMNNDFEGE